MSYNLRSVGLKSVSAKMTFFMIVFNRLKWKITGLSTDYTNSVVFDRCRQSYVEMTFLYVMLQSGAIG